MEKWQVEWMESERGWGQNYWTTNYDTQELAQAAIDEQNARNPDGYVPDYYIRAVSKPKKVYVGKHVKE